jgi:hypothetical protein
MPSTSGPVDQQLSTGKVISIGMTKGKREVGSGKWEVGSGKWEVGSGKWEVGSGKWEVGNNSVFSELSMSFVLLLRYQASRYSAHHSCFFLTEFLMKIFSLCWPPFWRLA